MRLVKLNMHVMWPPSQVEPRVAEFGDTVVAVRGGLDVLSRG
jgi:hypothetical protein